MKRNFRPSFAAWLRKFLVAAIVGGFGSLPGAIVGGLLVGIVEQFAGLYLPTGFADTSAYVILLLMLFVRPQMP